MTPAPTSDPDPQRALVQRVAGSTVFQKTWRLRELFLFLCERVRRDPEHAPREQEIGVAVFGRGDDFDPGVDPLVRVQTSQLRKRLHQYFTTEGVLEPVIIEIPRGAYIPVFRDRGLAPPEAPADDEAGMVMPRRRPKILALACVALLIISAVLAYENLRLRRAASPAEKRPTVEKLWRQLAGNGRTTYLILADGSLSVFLDTTRRVLAAAEYQRKRYATRYGSESEKTPPGGDPPAVVFSRQLMDQPLTGVAEADLALRAGVLSAAIGARTEAIFARDANPEHFKSHNLVLSGSRRANPWIELFEGRMSFRLHYDRPNQIAYFANTDRREGEAERYAGADAQTGYCRVAFLSNLDQTGSVLSLTGTDMSATGAGVELVTDEAAMADLSRALGVAGDAPFPPFEVLLKVQIVVGSPLKFERVAHRTYPAPPPR